MNEYKQKTDNFAVATVSGSHTTSSTTLNIVGTTAGFSTASTTYGYNCVWYNYTDYRDPSLDENAEIVTVTGRATNSFTIVRAQEGTTANNHNINGKTYKLMQCFSKRNKDFIENSLFPVGSLIMMPYLYADYETWLPCYGLALSKTTYSELYSVLGTSFGSSGSTMFKIPDMQGKIIVQQDTNDTSSPFYTFAGTGGFNGISISPSEMPTHGDGHVQTVIPDVVDLLGGATEVSIVTDVITTSVGSNGAHNNLMKGIVMEYLIKSKSKND